MVKTCFKFVEWPIFSDKTTRKVKSAIFCAFRHFEIGLDQEDDREHPNFAQLQVLSIKQGTLTLNSEGGNLVNLCH